MSKIEKYCLLKRGSLDTNEQVRKIDVEGGVSVQTLRSKVGRMVYKYNLVSPLLDYANRVKSPNIPEYIAVLKCGNELVQSENRFLKQSFYCGSRLCPNCSNIRSRKVSDVILAQIDMSKKWCGLTLTRSNNGLGYNLNKLQERLDYEQKWFNKVRDRYRKQGGDFSAIISLEVVPPGYKYKGKVRYYADYHPHYHILCTYDFAVFLKKAWLVEFDKDADEINQKIKNVQERKDVSYTEALLKTIRETIKYSLKACLPKDKKNSGSYSINVEGTDELVSLLKGRKRFKRWGSFLKKEKEIEKIENSSIEKLDLERVSYNDLPVQDTGDVVDMVNYKGDVVLTVPSFVKDVIWSYDYKRQNYYYLDEWGVEYGLIRRTMKKYKICVYEGRKMIRVVN